LYVIYNQAHKKIRWTAAQNRRSIN